MPSASKIFRGYRALGFTSNHVPLIVKYSHKDQENFVITCVGKAFHTYKCSRLAIVGVSDIVENDISCLAVDAIFVYVAHGNMVQAFYRGQVAHTYAAHKAPVCLLLPFGQHLISVDESSCLKVWDIQSDELYLELDFDVFRISALFHPSTYLNKIVVGSQQGALQLWNIRTNALLYTFRGWKSAVASLEQAPAVDVAAIGLQNGRVLLHNLKFDETLMSFSQDWGPVICISFRTDGQAVMVTSCPAGHIAFWDLEKRKLLSQILAAHDGAVTGLKCLASQPLMVTSSPDNAIKMWIFDLPDGGARMLRYRSGHSSPPSHIRFHGGASQDVLSAGQDGTLRSFSLVHDSLNQNWGRATYRKIKKRRAGQKNEDNIMPPITVFCSEPSRQSDWNSVITCHRGLSRLTTWHYQKHSVGAHIQHERFANPPLTTASAVCVTISSCGNFAVIGYSSGHVDVFNMESSLYRGSYGKPLAHEGCVRAVVLDGLNQLLATAGADRLVKFWKFKGKQMLASVTLDAPVARATLHRDSSMLAVALDDFSVVILDMDTRKVVRQFKGHRGTVNDMAFSTDSRWLVTASMDCSVRTWDLPTAKLVDCFAVDAAVTSVTFSATSDFLATAHVGEMGVFLWSNLSLFSHVALLPLPDDYEPLKLSLPACGWSHSQSSVAVEEGEEEEEGREAEEVGSEFKSPEQLANSLVTLSLLPHSRWQNLLNIDLIKQRNKPKEPPRVPKSAPFFLPTLPGLELKFAPVPGDAAENKSHVITSSLQSLTVFGDQLQACATPDEYISAMGKLQSFGPSAIDVELRSLSPVGGGSVDLMLQFLKMISHVLDTRRDFELVQAYLGLFLKLHAMEVSSERPLVDAVEALRSQQLEAWTRVQDMFTQSLCLLNYLRGAPL